MNPQARNQDLRAVPRTCSAVRRSIFVLALLAAVLLPALPLRADQDLYQWTEWFQGISTPKGTSTVYPLCVRGETTLWRRDTASNDALGNHPPGLYPMSSVVIGNNCTKDASGNCGVGTPLKVPPGQLAIYRALYIWNGSAWTTCLSDSDWIYNSTKWPGLFINSPSRTEATTSNFWTGSTSYPVTSTGGFGPCGANYYGLNSGTYAWSGSAWLGGWVWSGYLYSQ